MPNIIDASDPRAEIVGGVVQFLMRYGLGTAISLGLIYWIVVSLSSTVTATRAELAEHVAITGYYLRQLCFNTSTNESQRAACELPTHGNR